MGRPIDDASKALVRSGRFKNTREAKAYLHREKYYCQKCGLRMYTCPEFPGKHFCQCKKPTRE